MYDEKPQVRETAAKAAEALVKQAASLTEAKYVLVILLMLFSSSEFVEANLCM